MKSIMLATSASLMLAGVAFAAPGTASGKAPPPPPPAPKADAPVIDAKATAASDFTFDDVPMPEKVVGRAGGSSKEQSETAKRLAAIPVGKSWLEPVVVPDTITDAGERKTAFAEEAKKIQNRLTGAIRRHKKIDGNGLQSFSVLRVDDDTLGHGVRVYRNADETAATA